MRIRALILALPLLLSGCGIPPAVLVASSLVEGASVAKTGKSAPDYALSSLTDRDCVLLHGLTRGHVCEEPGAKKKVATAKAGKPGPVMVADGAPKKPSADPDTDLSSAPTYAPTWTLVLGTVDNFNQAVRIARRLRPKPGLITAVDVDGAVMYRVTTEPFKWDDAAKRERQVASQKFTDAELAAVCPYWMKDDKCVVLDRVLPL